MSDLERIISNLRQRLPLLEERYSVVSLGVFGSYVRHKQRPDSDLDILVTFETLPSLIGFVELEHYLSNELNVKVDLVMKDTLKPRISKRVLNEVVPV